SYARAVEREEVDQAGNRRGERADQAPEHRLESQVGPERRPAGARTRSATNEKTQSPIGRTTSIGMDRVPGDAGWTCHRNPPCWCAFASPSLKEVAMRVPPRTGAPDEHQGRTVAPPAGRPTGCCRRGAQTSA